MQQQGGRGNQKTIQVGQEKVQIIPGLETHLVCNMINIVLYF